MSRIGAYPMLSATRYKAIEKRIDVATHPGRVTLAWLLERQAGVVTLGQAVACGLSPDTVRRRVREGRWKQIHPTVHLVGGHRLTGEARVWAAWLYAGERSTVSGPAAAFRHGMLREPPDVVDVTVPAALHRRPGPASAGTDTTSCPSTGSRSAGCG